MQQSEKQTWLQSFVSLNWYAGVISFLFRFLAMTSEPLLALGVILSAADFLQQGHLMAHNGALQAAWSWAQAVSIEASTGPALAFALDAFRTGDKIKGRLYALLAALLFIVGGCMLYLQLISNATGMSEAAVTPWVLYPLLALRVLVASGIVALLCSKHLRFSGLVADVPSPMTSETMQAILARLAKVDELEQAMLRVTIQEAPSPLQITAPDEREKLQKTREFLALHPGAPDEELAACLSLARPAAARFWRLKAQDEGLDNREQIDEPIFTGRFQSKEPAIRAVLARNPEASVEQIVQEVGTTPRTAQRWMDKIRSEQS